MLAVVPCEGGGGKGVVELHSLRSQALAHILSFHSRVLSVCASARVIAVSLETQLHAFDAGAVQPLFTAVTYPAPGSFPSAHEGHQSTAPMALGHRWLAFASNQVTIMGKGLQPLPPSPFPLTVAPPSLRPFAPPPLQSLL